MYSEDDLLPVSALQHYIFCPRQCALIHLELLWEENRLTAEGRVLHERLDKGGSESRGDLKRVFALPLRSLELGVSGIADVVEYHRTGGTWRPYPVEHKRGRPRPDGSDEVQLCAQALCLEEMCGFEVPEGALFYGQKRRRKAVAFDNALRKQTRDTATRLHELFNNGVTPLPVKGPHCDNCSLVGRCMPGIGGKSSVGRYLSRMLEEESG